jgi:hypothetical protein
MRIGRIVLALGTALLLASCLVPGKFTAALDIRRDRSFTFTYVGEVYLIENEAPGPDGEKAEPTSAEAAKAKQEQERREVADALGKEQGFRSVRHLGGNRFAVDYATSGRLDHAFLFPFNSDAQAVFPWVAVELRKDGTARMKAPGFGDEASAGPPLAGLGGGGTADLRDGTFTMTTDAGIVMHNVEEGVAPGPRKTLVWRVSPSTKTVPTAVIRFDR